MKRLIAYPYSVTILVPNLQDKIVNNNITKEQYGPDIQREFLFDTDVEYGEWAVQEGKRLMKKKPWVSQFVKALNVQANLETEDTIIEDNYDATESEINVNDLPSIVWNDEEYRVLFNDDGTAELLNDFGNHVLTLEKATTITQVNNQLADQEVIVEEDVDNDIIDDNMQDNVIKEQEEQVGEESEDGVIEGKRLIKRLIKANAEVQDIITKAQQYAYIPEFKDEFDANLVDFENMINNITTTERKIQQDNKYNRTQRKQKYYDSVLLNDEDLVLFQSNICPACQNETLEIIKQDDDYWYVKCNECNTEFMIDTKTGEVFLQEGVVNE